MQQKMTKTFDDDPSSGSIFTRRKIVATKLTMRTTMTSCSLSLILLSLSWKCLGFSPPLCHHRSSSVLTSSSMIMMERRGHDLQWMISRRSRYTTKNRDNQSSSFSYKQQFPFHEHRHPFFRCQSTSLSMLFSSSKSVASTSCLFSSSSSEEPFRRTSSATGTTALSASNTPPVGGTTTIATDFVDDTSEKEDALDEILTDALYRMAYIMETPFLNHDDEKQQHHDENDHTAEQSTSATDPLQASDENNHIMGKASDDDDDDNENNNDSISPYSAFANNIRKVLKDCRENVYLAQSTIPNAGRGLFAKQDIPANTIVAFYPVHGIGCQFPTTGLCQSVQLTPSRHPEPTTTFSHDPKHPSDKDHGNNDGYFDNGDRDSDEDKTNDDKNNNLSIDPERSAYALLSNHDRPLCGVDISNEYNGAKLYIDMNPKFYQATTNDRQQHGYDGSPSLILPGWYCGFINDGCTVQLSSFQRWRLQRHRRRQQQQREGSQKKQQWQSCQTSLFQRFVPWLRPSRRDDYGARNRTSKPTIWNREERMMSLKEKSDNPPHTHRHNEYYDGDGDGDDDDNRADDNNGNGNDSNNNGGSSSTSTIDITICDKSYHRRSLSKKNVEIIPFSPVSPFHVGVTTKPISKNEELFVSYGYDYWAKALQRQLEEEEGERYKKEEEEDWQQKGNHQKKGQNTNSDSGKRTTSSSVKVKIKKTPRMIRYEQQNTLTMTQMIQYVNDLGDHNVVSTGTDDEKGKMFLYFDAGIELAQIFNSLGKLNQN